MHLEEDQIYQGGSTPRPEPVVAKDYLARAEEKRAEQRSRIPREWVLSPVPSVESAPDALDFIRTSGLLTTEEFDITETTEIDALVAKLATGQLSSVQVVGAFSKRAAIAHQL